MSEIGVIFSLTFLGLGTGVSWGMGNVLRGYKKEATLGISGVSGVLSTTAGVLTIQIAPSHPTFSKILVKRFK